MIVNDEADTMVFETTGRELYVHGGTIGISQDLEPSEGWDGGFLHKFSEEERKELSQYMVGLWTAFGRSLGEEHDDD